MPVCEELIAEIFARLPPKYLLRFRTLSTLWCSRIDSSDFIRKHASLCPQKVLFRQSHLENSDILYTLHPQDRLPLCPTQGYVGITPVKLLIEAPEVIGSCNGILCLVDDCSYTLWNPCIRRKLNVPHNSICEGPVTSTIEGFGYDPIAHDYKIVLISYSPETDIAIKSLVYSIKTGAWLDIVAPTTLFFSVVSWGYYVNGVLHWLVTDKVDRRYIMTFDLSTQVFGVIMVILPEPKCVSILLTSIDGSLAVMSWKDNYTLIWARKEYNNVSSWTMVLKLEGEVREVIKLTNGNLLVINSDYEFILYNPVTGVQSRLIAYEDHDIILMDMFIESLVLMDYKSALNENHPSHFVA